VHSHDSFVLDETSITQLGLLAVSNHNVYKLSDIAAEAQAAIQRDFKNIDPIVGVMRNMRAAGFPADAMTVDCLKSGKRIIFILHDDRPDEVD
jgi:hypothetical protein